MMNFRGENSTPDTWIACSQKLRRGASAARDRSRQSWKESRRLPPACFAVAGAVGTAARMGGRGSGPGAIQLEAEGDPAKRWLILMVYEIVVSGEAGGGSRRGKLAASHTGSSWKSRGGMGVPTDGQVVHIDAVLPRANVLSLLVDGHAYEIRRADCDDLHMWWASTRFAVN